MSLKAIIKETGGDDPVVLAGDASIDRMPGLSLIFEETGASFARFLNRYAEGISLAVEKLEASRANELAEQLGGLDTLFVFRAQEGDFRAAISVDAGFRGLAFELLLGSGVVQGTSARQPTRIEDRVIAYAVHKIVSGFAEAFSAHARFVFERESTLEKAGLLALGTKAAVVAFVRMTLRYQECSGRILMALPRTALDPFRAALSRLPGADGKATDEKWSEKLYNNIVRTEVKAEVRIEARGFTLGDISRLEVGDVLRLPVAPTSPIRIVSEGRTLFWCTLGQKDGMYTVRLEEFSDERESYIENILGV